VSNIVFPRFNEFRILKERVPEKTLVVSATRKQSFPKISLLLKEVR
jgi:hypothetical protein